jgi:4-amino-4-deoxy-L-arabinose transferase-like glycosyltransferase
MVILNKIKSVIPRLYQRQHFGRYFPILLLTFAFLLRLILVFILKTYSSPYHFSEHVRIADNILAGKGYSYGWYGLGAAGEGSFMPPVYVAIIVMAKIAFPSMPWLAIQIFQALLSACTAMLIYFIGKEIFTELVGVIASFLVAVYPPSLGYVLDIQTLTLEAFLVASTVLACIYWRKHGTWKCAFVLGFALGLAVLSRSNLILLLPWLLVWMVLSHEQRGAIHFIAMAGVFTLVLGPWVLRNYLVHEQFVLVSTNGGFNAFQGNNVNATGGVCPSLGEVWKQHPELARELAQLDEAARGKRLYQESIAFIRMHPKETLSLALKKFVFFWWFKPRFIEGGVISGYPWYYGFAYVVSYVLLLGFSIPGLVLSFEKYRDLFVFYALFLIQTFVSMVFVAGTRFRGVLEPLIIVLAACGIARALSRFSKVFRGAYQMQW